MDEVTIGEVHRRVEELHDEVEDLRHTIVGKDRVKEMISSHEAQIRLELHALEARISVLEQWQTWGMRIVLGLVLTAIVGLVIAVER